MPITYHSTRYRFASIAAATIPIVCLLSLLVPATRAAESAAPDQATSSRPLNVVLICADDLNTDLGCYGHPYVKSPNIDRLAARGVRFDRAYCQYPVCNPSRTSFLSGCYPDRTGVIDNATPPRTHVKELVFLPQHFRANGYRTLKVGKIFHTGDEFEDPASWDVDIRENTTAKNPPESQRPTERGVRGIVLQADDEDTWDGYVATEGIRLLEEASSKNEPFFLAIGFRRPHAPYIAPQRYHELYPDSIIPPLVEPAEHLSKIPPIALTYKPGSPTRESRDRAATAAAYYASLSFMDAQLGRVLDALDRLDAWDRTVVVFQSDHGYHLGEHGGLWHKMTLFERSTRVPLVVVAPSTAASKASPQLVELVDVFPTLCEVCQVPPPAQLQGKSLSPLLRDPAGPALRDATYTVVSHSDPVPGNQLDPAQMGRTVRTARYRYTEWFDGSRELYDYESDPDEYRNLAKDPSQREVLEQLRNVLSDRASR